MQTLRHIVSKFVQHKTKTMKAFIALAFLAVASAAPISGDADAPILSQIQEVNVDGSYHNSFETGNGISVQEQGSLKNDGEEIQGSVHYTAPDGTPIEWKYIANELGYQPEGAHLPVAPEIPEAILRSLAWNEAHPYKEEPLRKF